MGLRQWAGNLRVVFVPRAGGADGPTTERSEVSTVRVDGDRTRADERKGAANMFVRDFRTCREIQSGDGCQLRQLFNPLQDDLGLGYSFAIARLGPGESATLHRLKSSEVYYILTGRGELEIDGESVEVLPGQAVYVPPEARQRIRNTGEDELGFICIVDPAWRLEDEEILD